MKRAAITGLGPVTAIGIGREAFFAAIAECRGGVREEADGLGRAARIRDFDVADYLESRKNYLDRASELAFAAVSLALEDADLDPARLDRSRTGLLMGSALGNPGTAGLFFADYARKGPRFVKPVLFPHTYSNTTISLIAIEYGLSGYHVNFASGAVSSGCAIVGALDLITEGRADIVLAGGFETPCDLVAPLARSKAWDSIPGEGAGMIVLEDMDRAVARKARVYGELAGAGMTAGFRIADAMRMALSAAGLSAGELDLVSAGVGAGADVDGRELAALDALFFGTVKPPIAGLKTMTGETLGASGALQMCGAIAAMEGGFVPPVPASARGAPGDERNFVAGSGLRKSIRRVLLSNIDRGGSAVSLVVREFGG
jgi:3-oxoacyl-[acyl-carrier-protein] synthase II